MVTRRRSTKPRVHIISREQGWAIKKEGLSRATSLYKKKDRAIIGAKKFRRQGLDIVIHKRDGSIERWEKAKGRAKAR